MFTLNVAKRPNSKDFLSHPRIKNVIKEQELNETYALILNFRREKQKCKEVELQAKAKELDRKAQELKEMETRLQLLEIDLCSKMKQIGERANNLQDNDHQKENSIYVVDTTMFSSPVATPGSKSKRRESRYSDFGTATPGKMLISPSSKNHYRGRVFQLSQEKF